MRRNQFGVSTRLYRAERLGREHLLEIAAHGFDTVELFAARAHIDFHNEAALADLQQWLAEAGLEVASVHVAADEIIEQAVFIARRLPLNVVIVQATTPRETAKALEPLAAPAAALGVRLAIDSTSMTPLGSLAHFVETSDADIGICLDFGAAHRGGDLVDAIETSSEHLVAAKLPVSSGIDWAAAMTTVQKIGYEGALIFEAEARGPTKETLSQARATRAKLEQWLTST